MSASEESSQSPEGTNQASEGLPKGQKKLVRHRFKPQLSCTFCRNRKLKCDRNVPCDNCVKRNQAATCTYIHAAQHERASQVTKTSGASRDVQNQIRNLEDMVIKLMKQTGQKSSLSTSSMTATEQITPATSPDYSLHLSEEQEDGWSRVRRDGEASLGDTTESFGHVSINVDDQANYVGSEHWAAILDNIACLKDQLGTTDPVPESKNSSPGPISPDLLAGTVRIATKSEILAALPTRAALDATVNFFFDQVDMGSSLMHRPTFKKEIERFWADPHGMPTMWIGLLFAVMCLSTSFQNMSGISPTGSWSETALRDPVEAANVYREKIVQCLMLGNYTEPGPYTVETLFLYYIAEHFRTLDMNFGAWMLFGLCVRAAMRQGYHRDASHFSKVSVFRGEMQRRIWLSIMHLDLIGSFQVGLPRMIREGMYDTAFPRVLLDEDFDENTIVLPPSRLFVEASSCAFSISKNKIAKILGIIVDQANSVLPISYEEVMTLDRQLHDVYQQTADPIKMQSIDDLMVGDSTDRLRKFAIDLTYQKARCVLHRKFFVTSKTSATYPYPYSVRSCVEAAMRILQSQILMDHDSQPGRPLHSSKWKTSSLLSHDFLLAAMILCMFIGHNIGVPPAEHDKLAADSGAAWTHEEILACMRGSCEIWEGLSSKSKEALKVSRAMRVMLARVKGQDGASAATKTPANRPQAMQSDFTAIPHPAQNPVTLPGHQTISGPPPNPSWMTGMLPDLNTMNPNLLPTYSNDQVMSNEPLDWTTWDNFATITNLSTTPPELWNIDPSVAFPDQNLGFGQWQ